jgi:hypothetical protein
VSQRPGFEALAPFFRIIAEGLSGLVDGEDFFDTLAADASSSTSFPSPDTLGVSWAGKPSRSYTTATGR